MVYGLLKRYLGLLFLSACIIPNLFAGVTQKKRETGDVSGKERYKISGDR